MNINPEIVLAAARIWQPGITDWEIKQSDENCYAWSNFIEYNFAPHIRDHDAWALERALKKDGWIFAYSMDEKVFESWLYPNRLTGGPSVFIKDESDTLLLLKCVSAQTGIPLEPEQERVC